MPLISIIVPVYREEENIRPFLSRIERVFSDLPYTYETIFCLDPSPDRTEEIISEEISKNENIRLIRFTNRYGQPAATMAGIHFCKGDACVIIDVDLQDPPEIIEHMIEKWTQGNKVVLCRRRKREGETILKLVITKVGYWIINKISDFHIPENVGDFRLLDRCVIDELKRLNEKNAYLRGLVAYIGYKQTIIEYDRKERYSGISSYNRFLGSMKIAINGIVGFSVKPLQISTLFGAFFAFLGFLLGLWFLIQHLILKFDLTPGLTWTICLITFFAGVQLLSLGIIGEYIGRIYEEVRHRPLYIVERTENIKKME